MAGSYWDVKEDILSSALAALVASLIVFSLHPVFLFDFFLLKVAHVFLALLLGAFFLVKPSVVRRFWAAHYFLFVLMIFFYFLWIYTPFREFDRVNGYLGLVLLGIYCFCLKRELIYLSSRWFLKAFYWISILGLITYIFYVVGVPFPSFSKIEMIGSGLIYRPYFFSYLIEGQEFSIAGVPVYRNSSIFAEPGHYGIYLGLVYLSFYPVLSLRHKLVFVLSILSTFSAAAYLGLFLIVLMELVRGRLSASKFMLFAFLTMSCSFLFLSFYDEIYSRVLYKFGGGSLNEILEARALSSLSFSKAYHMAGFVGVGQDSLEVLGYRSSDFSAFLLRYGLTGIMLLIFICFLVVFTVPYNNRSGAFFIVLFFFLVFLHRSWMFDKIYWFYFLLLLYEVRASRAEGSARFVVRFPVRR